MNKPIRFPVNVRYTKEFLNKNKTISQLNGIALRMTKGYDHAVTVKNSNTCRVMTIHLSFLEEK